MPFTPEDLGTLSLYIEEETRAVQIAESEWADQRLKGRMFYSPFSIAVCFPLVDRWLRNMSLEYHVLRSTVRVSFLIKGTKEGAEHYWLVDINRDRNMTFEFHNPAFRPEVLFEEGA